jgi:hypothetical protein
VDPSLLASLGGMGGGDPSAGGAGLGPESLLALLAGMSLQGMGGQGGQAQQSPQAKGEGSTAGQSSMGSILPQLLQALVSPSPQGNAAAATGGGKMPGKGAAEPAAASKSAQPAQEPAALSVLRLLGMVR